MKITFLRDLGPKSNWITQIITNFLDTNKYTVTIKPINKKLHNGVNIAPINTFLNNIIFLEDRK